MIGAALIWGTITGLLHFVVIGAAYGNPLVDRLYQRAQATEPSVRRWDSRAKYLVTQFLGTQVEVFILTAGFLWLRPLLPFEGILGSLLLGLLFTGIRIYPRFWNMWIQSTYPRQMLTVEAINGTLSTFTIVILLHFIAL